MPCKHSTAVARSESLELRLLLAAYTYDNSFGTDGIAEAPASGSRTLLVAELSGGDILFVTRTAALVGGDYIHGLLASRFSGTGVLDLSYGSAGAVRFDANSFDAAAVGGDGSLVVVGRRTPQGQGDYYIARFTPGGALDPTFAGDGVREYYSAEDLYAKDVVVHPDGAITVLSHRVWGEHGERRDVALHRFTASGELDSSFSGDGIAIGGRSDLREQVGAPPPGAALAIDSQGRLVIAAVAEDGILVSRFTAAGEADPSFGSSGFTLVNTETTYVGKLAFQEDGKIVIAAADWLVRLTESGVPDSSFDDDGITSYHGYAATDLAVAGDGKITVVVTSYGAEVFRFLPNGSPDPSFAANSQILYAMRTGKNLSPDYAIFARDGAIIAGGEVYAGARGLMPGVARFEPAPDIFIEGRRLQIRGTAQDDVVVLEQVGDELRLTRNGELFTFARDDVEFSDISLGEGNNRVTTSVPIVVQISTGAGNDSIDGSSNTGNMFIHAGGGNDTVLGGAGDDEIRAGSGDNVVDGGPGNDNINAFGGNNSLVGGEGNDRMHSGDGNDTLIGGPGRDDLQAGDGDNLVHGDDGDDYLKAGSGRDTIYGGPGADRIYAGDGDNLVFGGDGNDYIQCGTGSDTIWGEVGYDSIKAGAGDDLINGGAGKDRIWGQQGNDRIYGRRGDDALDGGPGRDRLFGGEGNDKFHALDGERDTLDGGPGDDAAVNSDAIDLLSDIEA